MEKFTTFFSRLFSGKKKEPAVEKTFEEIYQDLGTFQYQEDGFSFSASKKHHYQIRWEEIEQINVYKKDIYTTDLICMDICKKDVYHTFHEELPGWYQLVLKTKEIFPAIPKDWDVEIIQPPFEANWRTIYQKNPGSPQENK